MHPLNNGSQVENVPALKPRVGSPGYFSESNDNGAPSYPGQDWFNAVIREFQTALSAKGVAFDPDKFDHLQKLLEASAVNSLQYRVGQKAEIHSAQIPDWLLKADGSIVSRTIDDVLWAHAAASGLVIAQATKDANPEQYAMYYGDGDGSTTFSLPNWYLGHFARGNPAGVVLGETLGDAIRNIVGNFSGRRISDFAGTGVFYSYNTPATEDSVQGSTNKLNNQVGFDASRVVPTANENRPKAGHVNICIERGKIPA
ncbi:hypothetical protein [Vibrio sp. McD22-P3]|uniref:hypothetical protein n=1 Tax=Vibrio sp. McD22-P3 TaxID=2724880 RepID=UPI001F2331D0|nr:hypothetical protein [Vibrio sp. McD22-P3]MCF4173519.1 hypothetical protein [Vibrio sp. McD22-P3]